MVRHPKDSRPALPAAVWLCDDCQAEGEARTAAKARQGFLEHCIRNGCDPQCGILLDSAGLAQVASAGLAATESR